MTRTETCSAAGGAVSMWMNLIDCTAPDAIMTTQQEPSTTGFSVRCPNTHGFLKYLYRRQANMWEGNVFTRLSGHTRGYMSHRPPARDPPGQRPL